MNLETEEKRFKAQIEEWKKSAGDEEVFLMLIDIIHEITSEILEENKETIDQLHAERRGAQGAVSMDETQEIGSRLSVQRWVESLMGQGMSEQEALDYIGRRLGQRELLRPFEAPEPR